MALTRTSEDISGKNGHVEKKFSFKNIVSASESISEDQNLPWRACCQISSQKKHYSSPNSKS